MCGRFVNFLKERETVEEFGIAEVADDARRLGPSWNVAPRQVAPVVALDPDDSTRRLIAARWGLVPSWSKDAKAGARMFNARSETAHAKPAFRSAFARRRCLVPANGYYEWQATADGKRPFYIHPADGAPAAFAGLWEAWGADEPRLLTFTILTTEARGDLARIHDRSPVVLARDLRDPWMDPRTTVDEARAILGSPTPDVVAHPVSTDVGRVQVNHPGLIEPLDPDGRS
jgi:putative SOS response-associated peptidase YedK